MSALAHFGDFLARNQERVRRVQWCVVGLYAFLLVVPVYLPLPGRLDFIWSNLTRFAQFVFWGIWWPGVILSMFLVGRAWCGFLCPEGFLSEEASKRGLGRALPRWITWPYWPVIAFALTTIYGQVASVYQYPGPALVVLGGSTGAAIIVGLLFGRRKRVWCRYLCPVTTVFAVISKLAPFHFRVDGAAWAASQARGEKPKPVNCAPLVPLRTMQGAADCHMCGRCSGFRGAIRLSLRSPAHEIVHVAGASPKPAETVLIIFGLMGLSVGAFHWSVSPIFIAIKQQLAAVLVEAGWLWPLEATAPWWLMTNYPSHNDVFNLLDGAVIIAFMLAVTLACGIFISSFVALATVCLGKFHTRRFHHLVQTLIPVAGVGVFIGLSALTVTQLRMDGITIPYVDEVRAGLVLAASLFSAVLAWKVARLYTASALRRAASLAAMIPVLIVADAGWWLFLSA